MMWRDTSISAATRQRQLREIRNTKLIKERLARKHDEEKALDELIRDKVETTKLEHDMQREEFEALYNEDRLASERFQECSLAASCLQKRWRGIAGRAKCRRIRLEVQQRENVAKRQKSALSKTLGRQRRAAAMRMRGPGKATEMRCTTGRGGSSPKRKKLPNKKSMPRRPQSSHGLRAGAKRARPGRTMRPLSAGANRARVEKASRASKAGAATQWALQRKRADQHALVMRIEREMLAAGDDPKTVRTRALRVAKRIIVKKERTQKAKEAGELAQFELSERRRLAMIERTRAAAAAAWAERRHRQNPVNVASLWNPSETEYGSSFLLGPIPKKTAKRKRKRRNRFPRNKEVSVPKPTQTSLSRSSLKASQDLRSRKTRLNGSDERVAGSSQNIRKEERSSKTMKKDDDSRNSEYSHDEARSASSENNKPTKGVEKESDLEDVNMGQATAVSEATDNYSSYGSYDDDDYEDDFDDDKIVERLKTAENEKVEQNPVMEEEPILVPKANPEENREASASKANESPESEMSSNQMGEETAKSDFDGGQEWTCNSCGFSNDADDANSRVCILCGKKDTALTCSTEKSGNNLDKAEVDVHDEGQESNKHIVRNEEREEQKEPLATAKRESEMKNQIESIRTSDTALLNAPSDNALHSTSGNSDGARSVYFGSNSSTNVNNNEREKHEKISTVPSREELRKKLLEEMAAEADSERNLTEVNGKDRNMEEKAASDRESRNIKPVNSKELIKVESEKNAAKATPESASDDNDSDNSAFSYDSDDSDFTFDNDF